MSKVSKSSRKKKISWPDDEMELLLDIWEELWDDLWKTRRNSKVLEDFSAKLRSYYVYKSPKEIKTKLHNLTLKYRAEKKNIRLTGDTEPSWCHFERVGRILERRRTPLERTEVVWKKEPATFIQPKSSEFPFRRISKHENAHEFLNSRSGESRTPSCLSDSNPSTSEDKIKTVSTHEKLLREIQRANLAAEKEMRMANEIGIESLDLQREILEFFRSQKK